MRKHSGWFRWLTLFTFFVVFTSIAYSWGTATAQSTPTPFPSASNQYQIVFTGSSGLHGAGREIYTINTDGTGLQKLTHLGNAHSPTVSPDGTQIAFAGSGGIYVINKDGSDIQALTDDDGAFPAWSPNGEYIAFISFRDRRPHLYVMNADGTQQRQLSDESLEFFEPPIWSPDSTAIAFVGVPSELYTVDVASGHVQLLANYAASPTWAPNSTQLAFAAYAEYGIWRIDVINADGSGQQHLTEQPSHDMRRPVWSPDGTLIAFVMPVGFEPDEIHTMAADGSNWQLLARNVRLKTIAWSPDSEFLVSIANCEGSPEIYLVWANGSAQQCLTSIGVREIPPVWMPSG